MRGRTCRRALMVGASRSVRPWPGHAVMPAGVPVDAHQACPRRSRWTARRPARHRARCPWPGWAGSRSTGSAVMALSRVVRLAVGSAPELSLCRVGQLVRALWIAGLAQPDPAGDPIADPAPSRAESPAGRVFSAEAPCVGSSSRGHRRTGRAPAREAQLACPPGQRAGADDRESGNDAFQRSDRPGCHPRLAARRIRPPAVDRRETRFSGVAGQSSENVAARSRRTSAAPATTTRLRFQQVIFSPWRPANRAGRWLPEDR